MDRSVLRSLPVKDRDMFINASVAAGIISDALTTSGEFICGIVIGDAAKIDAIESIEQAKNSIETINVSLGNYLKIYRAWVDQERELRIAVELLEEIPNAAKEYRMRAYPKLYPRSRKDP